MVTCRQSPPRDGEDHVHFASRISQNWQCQSLRCEELPADAYASIQPSAIPSCLRSRFQCGSDRCSVRATFCQRGPQDVALKHDTVQCRRDGRDRQTAARLAHFLPVTAGSDRTSRRPAAQPAAPHSYPARPSAMHRTRSIATIRFISVPPQKIYSAAGLVPCCAYSLMAKQTKINRSKLIFFAYF